MIIITAGLIIILSLDHYHCIMLAHVYIVASYLGD